MYGSPTISSLYSSDLDTESTGSFFPDRSTSLGSLMGVTLPYLSVSLPIGAARPPPRREQPRVHARKQRPTVAVRRKRAFASRWWRLCRDEDMARRTSLADFLQVERRLSYTGGGVVEGMYVGMAEHEVVGGGPLFDNGRVLPPPSTMDTMDTMEGRRHRHHPRYHGNALIRLTGICHGGEG